MSERKVTHRGFMLPFVEYDDDSMGLGIPAIIHDMFAANNRGVAAQDRVGRYREDGTMITSGDVARATAGDVLNVAGAAPLGGVAARAVGAMPDNALGIGGSNLKQNLPMDQASRLARQRDMGFDPENVWYRGTSTGGTPEARPNYFASKNPDFASRYAQVDGSYDDAPNAAVAPLLTRGRYFDFRNPDDMAAFVTKFPQLEGKARTIAADPSMPSWKVIEGSSVQSWLRDSGYDGAMIREAGTDNIQIFEPQNVRSVNAVFDPAKSGSANLLASNPEEAALVALLAELLDKENQ